MENYYININRQFGSLGRPIAIKLAEMLGIEFYDRDIVEAAAEKLDVSLATASAQEERLFSPFARMATPLGSGHNPDRMFSVQQQVIMSLAAKGPAIFVGRCAEYILRDRKCLNIFIYAPKEQRYLNCVNSLGMSPTEARHMIEKVDKARDRYWLKYTKHLPNDPEHCHLMLDSSLFGVNGSAELLATVARARFAEFENKT